MRRYVSDVVSRCLGIALAVICCAASAGREPVSGDQILRWMEDLEPLPKVHYSWPLAIDDLSDEQLFQYSRITHALSLNGKWVTQEQVSRAIEICNRVNSDSPKMRASFGIAFSPWHKYPKDLKTTAERENADEVELGNLRERAKFVAEAVATANRTHSADVEVTCVMLDSERFYVRPDDPEHNRDIDTRYNSTYDIIHRIFPKARIEWYNRGGVHPSGSPTGWSISPHFTGNEKGDSFSCSLYRTPEIETTREIFRRTAEQAEKRECTSVTPWLALASGYRRQTDQFQEWSYDWDYDLIYSYQLGSEINHPWFGAKERHARFAPWDKAEIAVFYPEPLGRVPHWGEHFIAYVNGAHLLKKLPGVTGLD